MCQEPGGFLPQTELTSFGTSFVHSRAISTLPHPREHPLTPGSNKEDSVRRWAEETLLNTSRRYIQRNSSTDPANAFKSMAEVCMALESIIDILWKSGTPSDFTSYVSSFPPSPSATFDLLRKLDHCFASLLCGLDIDSKEALPGFENGLNAGMTTTDMVRCRGLVERTRVLMVEILSNADEDDDNEEEEESEEDYNLDEEGSADAGEDSAANADKEKLHMDVARIYEFTVIGLGERMENQLGGESKVFDSTVGAH
ncbi:hypothetical protein E4U30_007095 [Claviceps sp. LM220 group G6]|nr:hypothetical protein E4U15_006310 [Claviceps sp. LM218 group G6]KAG6091361.1 hypothetical protein E4U30_007095 [Claviceps sp. LM220 group G6]